jgi:carbamoyl-phosphate synthase small subunit
MERRIGVISFMAKGFLTLETGEVFEGTLFGDREQVGMGEIVFNTSMTGYQEMITDPSYTGQIVTFCYPLIGNYGINRFDLESSVPQINGIILSDLCDFPSHFQAEDHFALFLQRYGKVGIMEIDTRTLVKRIRTKGTVFGMIAREPIDMDYLKQYKEKWEETIWVKQVSTKTVQHFPNSGPHIVLVDFGYKKSILSYLLENHCRVTVVPYSFSFEQIKQIQPDGVLLSNGPGNPETLSDLLPEIKKICLTYPTFGICLGHQLIALAFGGKTKKLRFGHRGVNHPVRDRFTGKVYITSQNHGYVVEKVPADFEVSFVNINDSSIEGMKHRTLPIQSVQFHPEAHPGPQDSSLFFETFILQVKRKEENTCHCVTD